MIVNNLLQLHNGVLEDSSDLPLNINQGIFLSDSICLVLSDVRMFNYKLRFCIAEIH